jgi:N-methylhydantoinase B
MRFPPYGLAGGQPGRPTRNVLEAAGAARELPATFAHRLRQGEVLVHEQAGGGGGGDPRERDPEAVAADVREEKITIQHARRAYGVAIDPVTLKVDADATRTLRAGAG